MKQLTIWIVADPKYASDASQVASLYDGQWGRDVYTKV